MDTRRLDLSGTMAIKQGATYRLSLSLFQANGQPYNLTGCTATAQLRENFSSTTATDFTCEIDENPLTGNLTLVLTAAQTALLTAGKHVWDLFITLSNDDVWGVLEGDAIVKARVTR